jgi:hypothetical protein
VMEPTIYTFWTLELWSLLSFMGLEIGSTVEVPVLWLMTLTKVVPTMEALHNIMAVADLTAVGSQGLQQIATHHYGCASNPWISVQRHQDAFANRLTKKSCSVMAVIQIITAASMESRRSGASLVTAFVFAYSVSARSCRILYLFRHSFCIIQFTLILSRSMFYTVCSHLKEGHVMHASRRVFHVTAATCVRDEPMSEGGTLCGSCL